MSAPRLPMRKIREVLRLKHERGLTHREVAHACSSVLGQSPSYVRRAAAHGWGWPLPDELAMRRSRRACSLGRPRSGTVRRRHVSRARPDGGDPAAALGRVCAGLSEGYRYSQFCVLYRQWARRLRPLRQVHRAGEKTFIDFSEATDGRGRTGEVRSVELCVAVLGASSYTYAEATATQQLPLGGRLRMVEGGTPDQLKSAITRSVGTRPGSIGDYEAVGAGPPGQAEQSRRRVRGARGATWILGGSATTFFSSPRSHSRAT